MRELINNTFTYLVLVLAATIGQILILLGPGLLLTFVISMLARSVQKLSYRCMGRSMYLGLFGWLGTSVHELGHAVFHLIFGHQIVEMKLFSPNTETNTLGYVLSRYRRDSLYQRIGIFFIGIGPILFGTLVIYLAYILLVQPEIAYESHTFSGYYNTFGDQPTIASFATDVSQSSIAILATLFHASNLLNWKFYLFIYLTFAIGSSIHLSPSDIEGALSGFTTLVSFLFLFNLGTLWLGDFANAYAVYISQFYGFFYAIMIFVVVLNMLVAVLLYTVNGLTRAT